MSDVSDRYTRLAEDFAATIATVPDDRWSSPSPCEGWAARDVVRHVVESHGMFLGLAGREPGEVPSVDDDPAAAFDAVRRVVAADLADPERAGATYDGFLGRKTFAEGIDQFISIDLVIHRWDLARATDGDETLEPDDVHRIHEVVVGVGDALREPGVFGPALEPPPGADEQTRLLAFLGRKAW